MALLCLFECLSRAANVSAYSNLCFAAKKCSETTFFAEHLQTTVAACCRRWKAHVPDLFLKYGLYAGTNTFLVHNCDHKTQLCCLRQAL